MLTRLIFVALCLFTSTASADSITKTTQESDSQFAARYLPNAASIVVHVASARVWGFERPVIVAFYEYSVTFSDKSKNYGDNPDDKEVLGIAFVPVNSAEYRKFEIQGYGPEGTTAQINSVFFSSTDSGSDKKLFVMVSWHNNAGVLYSTYAYEKPQLNSGSRSLVHLEKLSQTFVWSATIAPTATSPISQLDTRPQQMLRRN